MSYRIYTTTGFVIKQIVSGEADCWLRLFTDDLGLVTVRATGLRRITSKMAGHARAFIFLKVSLIKGKTGWRLVGAESLNLTEKLLSDREVLAGLERLFNLLNRLLIKEVAQTEIFFDLQKAVTSKSQDRNIKWADLEVILVIRWLYYLGYLPDSSLLRPFLSFKDWTASQIEILKPKTKFAISTINQSLRAGGL